VICSTSVLLVSSLIGSVFCDVFALPGALFRPGQSYSVTCTVHLMSDKQTARSSYQVEEFHSAWQQRSKINFRVMGQRDAQFMQDGIPRSGTLWADDQHVLLAHGSQIDAWYQKLSTCKHLTHQTANRLFTMGVLESIYKDEPSIIGPSRLLRLIINNLNGLEYVQDETSYFDVTIKSIKNRIKLRYDLGGGDSLVLYYSADSANNPAHGLPPELHLNQADKKVVYEFSQAKLLPENQFIARSAWYVDENVIKRNKIQPVHYNTKAELDLFSWDPAIGCASLIRKNQHDDKLDLVGLERTQYRFSFTSLPKVGNEDEHVELVVGYEPTIATLRTVRETKTRISEHTINFMQSTHYHVTKRRHGQQDYVFDLIERGTRSNASTDQTTADSVQDENVSCAMMTAFDLGNTPQANTKLGDILFGSNKFTYLGRARVRNIDALVFESYDSKWPVWYQAPSAYYKSESWDRPLTGQAYNRPQDGFLDKNRFILNTVIYLSANDDADRGIEGAKKRSAKSDYQEPIKLDNRLLLLEVYKYMPNGAKLLRKVSIEVHDFSWHITYAGIGHKNYLDFFAIGDDCPADEDRQYGTADLRLTLDQKYLKEKCARSGLVNCDSQLDQVVPELWSGTRRNLAIMRAFYNEAGLPTSMIYDFRSRLETDFSVVATLRLADHVRSIAELIYLGSGVMKAGYKSKFIQFPVLSFYSCHIMAVQFKQNTIFAFDSWNTRCYIYTGRVDESIKLLVGSAFDMNAKESALEVYRIRTNKSRGEGRTSLQRVEKVLRSIGVISVLPILDDGHEELGDVTWIKARIESFRMSYESKSRRVLDSKPANGGSTTSATVPSKLTGFGLVVSDKNNMSSLVVPETTFVDDRPQASGAANLFVTEMTFGQCRASCLSMPDCRAYSVCIRGGQVECVMTRADFRWSSLAGQLGALAAKAGLKIGHTIELDASDELGGGDDDGKVILRKYPTCELHNKNYLDLLGNRRPSVMRVLQSVSQFVPVEDREACAKMCFESTLKVLDEELRPMKEDNLVTLEKLETDEARLHHLFQLHQQANANICSAFSYLDSAANSESLNQKLLETTNNQQAANSTGPRGAGYCKPGKLQWYQIGSFGQQNETDHLYDATIELHKIDFSILYDKHHLITLQGSNLTNEEQEAFRLLLHAVHMSSAETTTTEYSSRPNYSIIRAFVERGDNRVVLVPDEDASGCSRLCFLQAMQTWPACKSFEIVEEHNTRTGFKRSFCRLNSVSLRETLLKERDDLVRYHEAVGKDTEIKRTYWHYEPKASLIYESADWAGLLQMGQDIWRPRTPAGLATVRVSVLSLLAFTVACLVLGVNMGLFMGKRFILTLGTIPEDKEDLIEPAETGQTTARGAVRIEFKNLATCHEADETEPTE
jgi:hypothetical protein